MYISNFIHPRTSHHLWFFHAPRTTHHALRTIAFLALAILLPFSAGAQQADDPAALLNEARTFTSQQRYSEAEQTYRKIIEQFPKSPLSADAYQELSSIFETQNRLPEADAALERLYETAPDGPLAPQALYHRAAILANLGRPPDAADVYRLLIRRFPDNYLANQAAIQLAGILNSQGKFDEAATALKRCLASKNPDEVMQTQRLLADTYIQAKRWYEAENMLLKVVQSQPGSDYYWEQLAVAYSNQKEDDKAADVYAKIVARHPGDMNYESKLFTAMDKAGKLDAEIKSLEAKTEKNPSDVYSLRWLVNIYMFQKRSIDALRELEKIVAAQPQDTDDAITLARLYFENQWKSKAVDTLNNVLEILPNDSRAWQLLGDIRHADGDGDGARKAWEKSVAFDPADPNAYMRLGGLYINKTLFAEATALYEQGRATLKNDFLFSNDLVFLYKMQMRPLDAINEYLRLISSGMPPPFKPDELLKPAEQAGALPQAVNMAASWLAKSPDSRAILQFYTVACIDAGRADDAFAKLADYSGLNPLQPDIFIETANELSQSGRYDGAATLFLKSVERANPPEIKSAALMGAARAYTWNNTPARAAGVLKKLISEYPQSPDVPNALFQLAGIEKDAGDSKAALEHYTQLVTQFPNNQFHDDAVIGEVYCLINTGQFQEADAAIEDLWKQTSASRFYDEMLYLRGEAFFLRGMFKEAQPVYKKLAESYPDSRFVHEALERLLFITAVSGIDQILGQTFMSAVRERAAGNLDEAATLFEGMTITMAKTPLAPYAAYELGRTRDMQGRAAEAEKIFLALADSRPDGELLDLALINAADVQIKLGRPLDALHTYQRLIDADPTSFWAHIAREKLDKLASQLEPGS